MELNSCGLESVYVYPFADPSGHITIVQVNTIPSKWVSRRAIEFEVQCPPA